MPLESRVEIDGDLSSISRLKTIEDVISSNSFPFGGAGDGSSYPVTIDPAETIRELALPIVAAEVSVEITTTGGSTFAVPVASPTVLDRWAIASAEIQDPNNNAARTAYWWAGE